jgi:hypothetical protein
VNIRAKSAETDLHKDATCEACCLAFVTQLRPYDARTNQSSGAVREIEPEALNPRRGEVTSDQANQTTNPTY